MSLQAFKESVQNEIQSLNKIILSLTARVTHLEEKLQSNSGAVRVDVVNLNQSSAEDEPCEQQHASSSYAQLVAQKQLLLLQTKVQYLSTQQLKLEAEKDREK